MQDFSPTPELLDFIVDRINVGVLILNENMEIQLWNKFMAANSGKNADDVLGKNLFDLFPELPQRWLSKKVSSVFMLKNFAFTSWEQRPYLFQFQHNRPVTGGMEHMCQDLTLMPVKNAAGEVESICIIVFDVTDTAIYQTMRNPVWLKNSVALRDMVPRCRSLCSIWIILNPLTIPMATSVATQYLFKWHELYGRL